MTSLARGLTVIRAFSDREPHLSIAEVARHTGLSRAAARRCLYTLEQLGYAGSDGRIYFLKPKVLALGHALLSGRSLAATIQPFLERVSDALHESCSAAVLDEDEIVYIARAATKRIMSVSLSIGSRLPAYCTSLGRVLLAALTPAEVDSYFTTLKTEALTERTITERPALRRIVEQTRQRGYALVDQELEIGLRSVSIPLVNPAGQVVAAMNVSTQAQRVGRREIERRFLPVMRAAAEDLRLALT
jgi:IclR family pca regulon transcriptional regulator